MVCLCVVISGFSDFFNEFFKSGIRWTLPVTDTSTDTPCPEATNSNSLLSSTVSNDIQQHVNSANSGDVDNDSQSDCHSDSDSCAPDVMVPDARVFSSIKNEQKYQWLYASVVHQWYLCKFCDHSTSSQNIFTVGINLGIVWLLFYYWTSKLINLLLFHLFPIHIIYVLIFPIIRAPGPRYKWVGKSLYIYCIGLSSLSSSVWRHKDFLCDNFCFSWYFSNRFYLWLLLDNFQENSCWRKSLST